MVCSSAHHERQVFPITYVPASPAYNAINKTLSRLEISCHPLDGVFDFDKRPGSARSDLSKDMNRLIEGGPESLADREKWQLLTRELAQKQEIIHRMMKEQDDKTQSLRLTSSEIVDLRRTIKML